MNTSGKVLLGALAGVAVGAVLGILLAPDKGSNTRRKILSKSDEYIDDLKEKFSDLIDSLSERVEQVKNDIEEGIDEGGDEALAKGSQKAQDLKRDFKDAAGEKIAL